MKQAWLVILTMQAVCTPLGYWIGRTKGQWLLGAVLGFVLTWVGLIVIAVYRPAVTSATPR